MMAVKAREKMVRQREGSQRRGRKLGVQEEREGEIMIETWEGKPGAKTSRSLRLDGASNHIAIPYSELFLKHYNNLENMMPGQK